MLCVSVSSVNVGCFYWAWNQLLEGGLLRWSVRKTLCVVVVCIQVRFESCWIVNNYIVAERSMCSCLWFFQSSPLGVCIMYGCGVFVVLAVLPAMWFHQWYPIHCTSVLSGIAVWSQIQWRQSWSTFCCFLNCLLADLNCNMYIHCGHWTVSSLREGWAYLPAHQNLGWWPFTPW